MRRFEDAFRGRRIFITGHTGFKGSWLTLWLSRLGASVTGYALPASEGSIYEAATLDESCRSIQGDLRAREELTTAIAEADPEVVFHLAAQAIVLTSYDDPLGTFETNVMGTAHLLEAVRRRGRPCAVVVVTSDKCYENRGWDYSYRETDRLGGHDPYSASKAAAELVTTSYRRSYFEPGGVVRVATARAGNVIGGGDRGEARIVPDCIAALASNEVIRVRHPGSVRPWQHVLEPISGYLSLAAGLLEGRPELCDAWNFGPRAEDTRSVEQLVEALIAAWGSGEWMAVDRELPHEAKLLRINADKAGSILGWTPRWSFEEAVTHTVAWYREAHGGASPAALRDLSFEQIDRYREKATR